MSNLIQMTKNEKVESLNQLIQSGIKSVQLLAQKDEIRTQGYVQAFLSEFARRPALHVCTDASVFNAFMFSVQIGLKVGGPRPQAALIDYKKSVRVGNDWKDVHEMQLQPMYPGLNKLMYETGIVESVNNELVMTDGTNTERYSFEGGTTPKIAHTLDMSIRSKVSRDCMPNPPVDALEKYLIAAYTVIKLKTGGTLTTTPLDVGYLMRIRQTSKGAFKLERGKGGSTDRLVPNLTHPWFLWWEKMAKKSSLISASKELPSVDNTNQLFTAVRFDELQSVGDLRTVEIAEEIGIHGIMNDMPKTQIVSAGIPQPDIQDQEPTQSSEEEQVQNSSPARPKRSPEVRALAVKLSGIMSSVGIKAASDQASVFKSLIGDDSKLNDASISAAKFLLETSADLWDKVNLKYEDKAPAVVEAATDGLCKSFVDVVVHSKTEALKELVG